MASAPRKKYTNGMCYYSLCCYNNIPGRGVTWATDAAGNPLRPGVTAYCLAWIRRSFAHLILVGNQKGGGGGVWCGPGRRGALLPSAALGCNGALVGWRGEVAEITKLRPPHGR